MAVFSSRSLNYIAAFCAAIAALAATSPVRAASEKVVYSFKGAPDGANPGALINVGGTLYGTTAGGGGSGPDCFSNDDTCGTVFKVTTDGAETVLYAFKGEPDGCIPNAALINSGGVLYGTTLRCGTGFDSYGTVFKVTTAGAETVLHSFQGVYQGANDGANPEAGLINIGGTLYGTTSEGGNPGPSGFGYGTVFKITKAGTETVLYSFTGTAPDGYFPTDALINVGGTLYGTTSYGGDASCSNNNCCQLNGYGCGTVFKVTEVGAETVLYSFVGGSDAYGPNAGLIDVDRTLYGTTPWGGGLGNCSGGCGTVFNLTMTGAETVEYRFQTSHDGLLPSAGLIKVGDKFYGTTSIGGKGCGKVPGCGTVFSLTKTGIQKVVYRFAGSDTGDGAHPTGGLINVDGTLYGTTVGGGSSGNGTVFAITP
jgi:uncharacterized repeat protein (TIGR03803 family)